MAGSHHASSSGHRASPHPQATSSAALKWSQTWTQTKQAEEEADRTAAETIRTEREDKNRRQQEELDRIVASQVTKAQEESAANQAAKDQLAALLEAEANEHGDPDIPPLDTSGPATLGAHSFNVAEKSEYQINLESNLSIYFNEEDDKKRIMLDEDVSGALRALGKFRSATIFIPATDTLVSDFIIKRADGQEEARVEAKIGICPEKHIPHIRLYVFNSAETSDDPDIDEHQTEKTRFNEKVQVSIAYDSILTIQPFNLRKMSSSSRNALKQVNIPQDVINLIEHSQKEPDVHAILVLLRFDPSHIRPDGRFNLNTPEWAQPFVEGCKIGELGVVVYGNQNTMGQISTICKVFQENRAKHPLTRHHKPGRRFVFSPDRILTLSDEDKLHYDYKVCNAFASLEDFLTVFCSAMIEENKLLTDNVSDYESKPKAMQVLKMFGANENVYMAFLPIEEEDQARISEDDVLYISFHDTAKKAAPVIDLDEMEVDEQEPDEQEPAEQEDDDQAAQQPIVNVNPEKTSDAERQQKREQAKKEKGENAPWTAKVIAPDARCPPEMICIWLKRPWDSKTGEFKDNREIDFCPSSDCSNAEVRNNLLMYPPTMVTVKIDTNDQVMKQNLIAADNLYSTPKNKERLPWNDRSVQLALGKDLHALAELDIFEDLREEFPHPEELMPLLNHAQKTAVVNARKALGGWVLLHGPPGTGKTWLLIQFCTPWLLSVNQHQVLLFAPSNEATDNLAVPLRNHLDMLKTSENPTGRQAPFHRYGLRLHSKSAEDQIKEANIKERRPPPDHIRDFDELIAADMDIVESAVEYEIRQRYDQGQVRKYPFVRDPRVQNLDMSPAYRMLIAAGLVQDPTVTDKEVSQRRLEHADFIQLYNLKVEGRLDRDQAKEYGQLSYQLFTQVVSGASFIVATTFGAGTRRLLDVCESQVSVVMIDEAAHEREDNLLPIYEARFSRAKGFIHAGDHIQLAPHCQAEEAKMPFKKQLEKSVMLRLLNLGFPYEALTLQNRMVEDIVAIANKLAYDNQLTTHTAAELKNRPIAGVFLAYARKIYHMGSNVIFMDVMKGDLNVVDTNSAGSRYNTLFAILIINEIPRLLKLNKTATIGVITGYKAQRNIFLAALTNMLNDPELVAMGVDKRVRILTFDAAIGKEFDYVLMDLLVARTHGFLADRRRLVVALTRARNGLIIVGNVKQIEFANRGRGKSAVASLARILEPHKVTIQVARKKSTYPKCKFYTPEISDPSSSIYMPATSAFARSIFDKSGTDNDETRTFVEKTAGKTPAEISQLVHDAELAAQAQAWEVIKASGTATDQADESEGKGKEKATNTESESVLFSDPTDPFPKPGNSNVIREDFDHLPTLGDKDKEEVKKSVDEKMRPFKAIKELSYWKEKLENTNRVAVAAFQPADASDEQGGWDASNDQVDSTASAGLPDWSAGSADPAWLTSSAEQVEEGKEDEDADMLE